MDDIGETVHEQGADCYSQHRFHTVGSADDPYADDEQRDVQQEDDEADSSAEQVVGYHDDTADPARHDMTSHKLQAASHKLGVRSLGLAAWGCQAVILSQQAKC